MKQRKIITWILVLTVCLALFSAAAFADETETGWSLDENGVLTISSDDGMSNWVNVRLQDSKASQVTSVVIESGVTAIAAYAFDSCINLTEITIPDSVTSIGDYAFCWCSSLTAITIPASVTSIGANAFAQCAALTTVTFGDNSKLETIGEKAFDACTSLTTIAIPDSVTTIGDYAFLGCTSLSTVEVSCVAYKTIQIGSNAFEDAATSTVTITHTYDADHPLWSWSEDYSSATVSFTCADCGDVHTENATVTSEVSTAATETEAGVTVYTAVAKFNGLVYADIRAVTNIPATGHSYGDPVFTWAEDYGSATASFTCANCDDTVTETCEVTSETTAATCTTTGETVYTASVTFESVTYTEEQTVVIPATGDTSTDTTTPTPSPTAAATDTPEPTASAEPTATAAAAATASPVNTSPSTGDEANPLLWALLAIVCAAGLGVATTLSRKGRKSR
ncbi:MAG: leucine-rich repeat domain-containing protein [Oscillospiraceae bacterium]|nr:leucine-rich repeat domain-containing protein [Oscillospiraceae bacterium]